MHADCLMQLARVQQGRVAAQPRVPVGQWSPQFVRDLLEGLDDHLRQDLAASSQASYTSHLRQFRTFCDLSGRPMRPEGRLLAAFVIGRVHQKYALSYIKGGVAAVARWATERGVAHLGQEPVVV